MTVDENTIPVMSVTPRVMLLTSDTGLPVEKKWLYIIDFFHKSTLKLVRTLFNVLGRCL